MSDCKSIYCLRKLQKNLLLFINKEDRSFFASAHQVCFDEFIQVSIQHSVDISGLIARAKVLDHLIGLQHITADLAPPLYPLLGASISASFSRFFSNSIWYRRDLSMRMAISRFWICERVTWHSTIMPEGW